MVRGEASRPLASYAGSYHDDRLGGLRIELADGHLFGQLGIQRAEHLSLGGDEFGVDWQSNGEPVKVRFVFGEGSSATRFEWDDRIFERMKDR